MKIRNLFLLLSRQLSKLQLNSEAFWQQASNSYFASSEVYDAREAALRDALSRIGPVDRAIDVGCGDGRFTLVLWEFAVQVVGYDISEPLIEQARSSMQPGVEFHVAEIEQFPTRPQAGLVSCLGVTSCIVDDAKFGRVLDRLIAATAPGGHFVTVDTLSDGREETRAYRSGYIGKYRERAKYEQAIAERGMDLIERRDLAGSSGFRNYLYLFKRRA